MAALAFSSFGTEYAKVTRRSAAEYLEVLAYVVRCRTKASDRPQGSVSLARARQIIAGDGCALLLDRLSDLLPESGDGHNGEFGGAVDDITASGFTTSGVACLAGLSNDPIADVSRQIEDYIACEMKDDDPTWAPDQRWLQGLSSSSPAGDYTLEHTPYKVLRMDGKTETGDKYKETWVDENGDTVESVEDNSTIEDPDPNTDTEYVSTRDETRTSGNTTTRTQSTSVTGTGSVETTTQTGPSGTTTTTTVTIELDDGSTVTWETTVDENGDVTDSGPVETPAPVDDTNPSEETDETMASIPVDEPANACASILHDVPDNAPLSDVDPLIRPAFNDVGDTSGLLACFASLAPQPAQCTTAFLCPDGVAYDSTLCICGTPVGQPLPSGGPGRYSANCAQLQCGPDASCDPETGTCRGSGGIEPPVGGTPIPLALDGSTGLPRIGRDLRGDAQMDLMLRGLRAVREAYLEQTGTGVSPR